MKPKELKAWREKNGYTQARLGAALGVTTITVSRWENKARAIPSFLHLALAGLEKRGGEAKKIKGKKKKEGGEDKWRDG